MHLRKKTSKSELEAFFEKFLADYTDKMEDFNEK